MIDCLDGNDFYGAGKLMRIPLRLNVERQGILEIKCFMLRIIMKYQDSEYICLMEDKFMNKKEQVTAQ